VAETLEDAIQIGRTLGIGQRDLEVLELVVESPSEPLLAIVSSSTDRPAISPMSWR
jgi:hypothetical protein